MNTNLQIFNNTEFGNVTTIEMNNEVWFLGKEIAEILGYKATRNALNDHIDEEDVKVLKYKACTDLMQSNLWGKNDFSDKKLINESGLYSLILNSKMPSAKKFKHWVTSEILPSIRKTGRYSIVNNEEEYKKELAYKLLIGGIDSIEAHKKLVEIETKPLIETIEKQQPKVDYADNVLEGKNTYNVTQIAKDYGLSARSFNSILHDLGIQYKSGTQWVLYAKYQNKGYTKSLTDKNENGYVFTNTKWTQKGRMFLYEILKENGYVPTKVLN